MIIDEAKGISKIIFPEVVILLLLFFERGIYLSPFLQSVPGRVTMPFVIIMLYCFPKLLNIFSIFTLGIIADLVGDRTIGISSFAMLIAFTLIAMQRSVLARSHFFMQVIILFMDLIFIDLLMVLFAYMADTLIQSYLDFIYGNLISFLMLILFAVAFRKNFAAAD